MNWFEKHTVSGPLILKVITIILDNYKFPVQFKPAKDKNPTIIIFDLTRYNHYFINPLTFKS